MLPATGFSGVLNCFPRTIARAARARGRLLREAGCRREGSSTDQDYKNGRAPRRDGYEKQGKPPRKPGGGRNILSALCQEAVGPFTRGAGSRNMIAIGKSAGLAVVLLGGCAILERMRRAGRCLRAPLTEAKARISQHQASYKAGSQTRWMRSAGLAPDGLRVKLSNAGTLFGVLRRTGSRLWIPTRPASRPIAGIRARRSPMRARNSSNAKSPRLSARPLTGEPVDADVLRRETGSYHDERPAEDCRRKALLPTKKWVQAQQDAAIQRVEDQKAGWAD